MKNYDIDYFIKKFESIPEDEFCIGVYKSPEGRKCFLGHCGMRNDLYRTNELMSLEEACGYTAGYLTALSDGKLKRFQQPTIKKRILAFLLSSKKSFVKKGK